LTKWKLVMSPPKYVPDVASDPTKSGVDEFVTFEEFVPEASWVPFLKIRRVVPDRVTAKCTH
jgi:hypothetical protein